MRISDITQQAFSTGHLTIEAENQLRQLLKQKNNDSELQAFMDLQEAARQGWIKQESRAFLQFCLNYQTSDNFGVVKRKILANTS
ncbi:MAG: hypothetical protein WA865_10350 [Spirulinaceae cyanobacterium]